jgi:hypothetical protein
MVIRWKERCCGKPAIMNEESRGMSTGVYARDAGVAVLMDKSKTRDTQVTCDA